MRRQYTKRDESWEVGNNAGARPASAVLLQISDRYDETRIVLTAEEAEQIARALLNEAKVIRRGQ